MQPTSNSTPNLIAAEIASARSGILGPVIRSGLGLGMLIGAALGYITVVVEEWGSLGGIALFIGAIVGFILGLLAGLVDAFALRAAVEKVLPGTVTPRRAAARSATLAVLLIVAPATIGISILGIVESVVFLILALNIVAWLLATWVGNHVLKSAVERALYETPSPGPSYLDLSLLQPSHAAGPVDAAHAPLAPIAPELPFTPAPPTLSPHPFVPSRRRPPRRLPHPLAGHARS
jgi:hypothetical protein